MPIRLATSCSNCNNLSGGNTCTQHKIQVTERHICDSFSIQEALKKNMNCGTCTGFHTLPIAHTLKRPLLKCYVQAGRPRLSLKN